MLYTVYAFTFPIWAFVFLFWRECKISGYMATPFGKFVNHTSQFCIFLFLLVLSSLKDHHEPDVVEFWIYTYVLAMCVQQARNFWRQKSGYFLKWWNCVLTAMLLAFLLSGLGWIIGSTTIGGWSTTKKTVSYLDVAGHKILLLANSCFSTASILSVFYLGSFCQVNYFFGPLHLSTLRMVKDIGKFLTIFLGVFFAFTLGVRNLYSYNESLEVEYFGRNSTTDPTESKLSTFGDAWQVMFWALFDQTEIQKFETARVAGFEITGRTGKIFFAIYLITAVLVGINMLIAMMNNSFEYVANDENAQRWKMSRTAMWLEFVDKYDHLPPPYNIVQFPIDFVRELIIKNKCQDPELASEDPEKIGMNRIGDVDNNDQVTTTDEDRKTTLKEIRRRYLEKGEEELNGEALLKAFQKYFKDKPLNVLLESTA